MAVLLVIVLFLLLVTGFFMALDNYSPQLRLVGFFDGHFTLCIVADMNKDVKISLSIVAVDF